MRPRLVTAAASCTAAAALIMSSACLPATHDHEPAHDRTQAVDAGGHLTESAGPPAPDADGLAAPLPTAVPAAAVDAATRFADAWARPHLPADRWREDVAALATAEYATMLRTVDPANVPATRITGQAWPRESTTLRVVVDVPTDAGTLRLVCVASHGRWLVATVQMVDG
ncbi:hypothetical protein [Catenuloplanes atrovinosus]|uniref:Lipoprotein n=1 Tax=Catenuloplanes atrovinosus TaxID=137266 RepID=A0AAE4CC68_9ACTN|nr:hypothetical protein [Catenuloplanes atrovinosus]MDR7277664.1 hypothetical protein [Catenuloplanes atrovinosus]